MEALEELRSWGAKLPNNIYLMKSSTTISCYVLAFVIESLSYCGRPTQSLGMNGLNETAVKRYDPSGKKLMF